MSSALLWVITVALLTTGLIGTVLPALPGLLLIIIGVLFFALSTNFASISVTTVIVLACVALIGYIIGYVSSGIGAKISGGGKYSVLGTIIGALIGLTVGPLGIFAGAIIGAFLGALYESKSFTSAWHITVASLVGLLSGAIVQFLVGAGIIIAFFVAVVV